MEKYFFHPSEGLDSYLYSIFLEYASVEELEMDLLYTQTHWQLVKYFDNACEEYKVWFVNGVAVKNEPIGSDKKLVSYGIRRYYDMKNPYSNLNGAIIQPNIDVY
jgi:UDP-glucose 6-dehydrogenase